MLEDIVEELNEGIDMLADKYSSNDIDIDSEVAYEEDIESEYVIITTVIRKEKQ